MTAYIATVEQNERVFDEVEVYIKEFSDSANNKTGYKGFFQLPLERGIQSGEAELHLPDGRDVQINIETLSLSNGGYHVSFVVLGHVSGAL